MKSMLLYITDIQPEPWTVPDISTGRNPATGKVYPIMSKKPPLRGYQAQIEENIRTAYPDLPMFPDDAKLTLHVVIWRQIEQYQTAKGANRSRMRADATNILKATEDALQKLVFKNDVGNVKVISEIVEQEKETRSGLLIYVKPYVANQDWSVIRREMDACMSEAPFPPGNVYVQVNS